MRWNSDELWLCVDRRELLSGRSAPPAGWQMLTAPVTAVNDVSPFCIGRLTAGAGPAAGQCINDRV